MFKKIRLLGLAVLAAGFVGASLPAQALPLFDNVVDNVSSVGNPQIGVLELGEEAYVDRDYEYTKIPTALRGLERIVTANSAKGIDNFKLTFDVTVDATLYLIVDDRLYPKDDPFEGNPDWIAGGGWVLDPNYPGSAIETDDTDYDIYTKNVTAGTHMTLGHDNGSVSFYMVAGKALPVPDLPAPTAAMPEPTGAALFGVGALIMARVVRRGRKA